MRPITRSAPPAIGGIGRVSRLSLVISMGPASTGTRPRQTALSESEHPEHNQDDGDMRALLERSEPNAYGEGTGPGDHQVAREGGVVGRIDESEAEQAADGETAADTVGAGADLIPAPGRVLRWS
jgi:hypothetical protein